ncbi:ATP-binding protein [Isosphaeraceae bacterium EP7]
MNNDVRRWVRLIPVTIAALLLALTWQLVSDVGELSGSVGRVSYAAGLAEEVDRSWLWPRATDGRRRDADGGVSEEDRAIPEGAGATLPEQQPSGVAMDEGRARSAQVDEKSGRIARAMGRKVAAVAVFSLGLVVVLGILAAWDRAERGRVTSALYERDERWRLAVSRVGEAVLVADAAGKTTELNEAAEAALGLSSREALGTSMESLLARIGIPGGGGGWGEVAWKNPSRAILDAYGRAVGVVAVVAVGRFRGEAEAAVRESSAVAARAIAAKDRFLAVLSHELRTPLTPVLMSVSAALDDPSVPAELHATLDMIRRNIELEARLIDDLLDASLMDRGPFRMELELVDVHEALREALAHHAEEATFAGLQVRIALDARRHHTMADRGRLIQVFWSLIHNAAKYTRGPAGSLQITSAGSDDTGRLILEFVDDGIGFDVDRLSLLFRPFEQGPDAGGRRSGGLGLGLSIGRHILESLGGTLDAQSQGPGHGATFRVGLSTVTPPEPGPASPAKVSSLVKKSSAEVEPLRILLVEDNSDTLRYIATVLKMKGHEIESVDRVEAAREALSSSVFDLLISDIELPDGTGLELMAEARLSGMKGIAMSGFGSDDDLLMSEEAGFSMHLTKPIDVRSLEAAIRQVSGAAVAS